MTRPREPGEKDRDGERRRVILASSSPRRRELLGRLVSDFDVVVPNADEERRDMAHPVEHAANLAVRKAEAAAAQTGLVREGALRRGTGTEAAVLIAADTVVYLGNRLLEKPTDRGEARRFLKELSGRSHTVCTALSILRWRSADGRPAGNSPTREDRGPDGIANRIDSATLTEVRFHRLSDSDIEWYLTTGEWQGVAGGYRLQGAGAMLISAIRGSYTNVVGLPLETLFSILRP